MASVFSIALRGNPAAKSLLTPALQTSVENDVLKGRFGTEGLETLSQVLCELGADAKGYLGVYLCPYGTEYVKDPRHKSRKLLLYTKTVAAWIVYDSDRRKLNKLSTDQFSRWLRENIIGSNPNKSALHRIEELSRAISVSPGSSVSQTQLQGKRLVPPPSNLGITDFRGPLGPQNIGRFPRPVPPPSRIDTVTGEDPSYSDLLSRAEHEFIDTPRISDSFGQKVFDQEEFVRRADELDRARRASGLPPIGEGVTPSVYRR